MKPDCSRRALPLVLALAAVTAAPAQDPAPRKPATTAEKIAYYQRQIAEHPQHYPAYARLGRAWLDQARQAYDPAALAEARKALRKSLEIQASFEGLRELAAVANYSHRFEEALGWCRQAAETSPQDKAIVAMQVEALLALGRGDEARALLGPLDKPATDFYSAAARANWHAAQGEQQAAADGFQLAATLAQQQKATPLAVWAMVSAAGVWLDKDQPSRAKPLLDEALRLDPHDSFLKIHQAELAVAEKRHAEALAIYEDLLKRQADPELHRRAFVLARQQGLTEAAGLHRQQAEELCRRAIDAGEVYSLETLAQLHCDLGQKADALRWAEQNLQHKHDGAAKETLTRAREL